MSINSQSSTFSPPQYPPSACLLPPAGGASLGIYAETYSPSGTARVTAEGEVIDAPRDSRTARAERYALKMAAHRLLPRSHRTTKCMHWRLPDKQLQVLRGATTDRAFFHGLQVCAMPWTCPVCAAKISERRRHEVAHAIKQAELLGWRVRLLTLTVPHGMGDDVASIVDRMSKAWTRLWQGKAGVQLNHGLCLMGHIRALEVTHGANGFHPHFHALMFYHPDHTKAAVWAGLPATWQRVAVRAGLPEPSLEHGCRVDDGDKAAAYVSKGVWGLESELTKGHVKKGRKGSRTPFDLLRDYRDGDKHAGALWRVYVDAFEGRRQLYWSNGLRKRLALSELSDDEICNKPDDERSLVLAIITDEQWSQIYRRRMLSAVLDLAEVSVDALRRFLEWLIPIEGKCDAPGTRRCGTATGIFGRFVHTIRRPGASGTGASRRNAKSSSRPGPAGSMSGSTVVSSPIQAGAKGNGRWKTTSAWSGSGRASRAGFSAQLERKKSKASASARHDAEGINAFPGVRPLPL